MIFALPMRKALYIHYLCQQTNKILPFFKNKSKIFFVFVLFFTLLNTILKKEDENALHCASKNKY